MTFENWIRTQIDLCADVTFRLGLRDDGSGASLMAWSDQSDGTVFWKVEGDKIELITRLE